MNTDVESWHDEDEELLARIAGILEMEKCDLRTAVSAIQRERAAFRRIGIDPDEVVAQAAKLLAVSTPAHVVSWLAFTIAASQR